MVKHIGYVINLDDVKAVLDGKVGFIGILTLKSDKYKNF
jgi:hypothetical protein